MAPTRKADNKAFEPFIKRYQAKNPKATAKLEKDRSALPAFFDLPAAHGVNLRTPNPIESTFATVHHRTSRPKNCVTRSTFLGLAFKMSDWAAKAWRRLRAIENMDEVLNWAHYADGVLVTNDQKMQK